MKKISEAAKFLAPVVVVLLLAPGLEAKGHFEFGFHYGSWGINIIKGALESALADAMKSGMVDKNKDEHPDLVENYSNTSATIDSSGHNYGFEARWYPGGENGSFSLGLAVEQTSMTVKITDMTADIGVSFREAGLMQTASISGSGAAEFSIKPLSFLLNFRWDIIPKGRVHPYITFGFGFAPGKYLDEARMMFDMHGEMTKPDGTVETFSVNNASEGVSTGADLRKKAEDDAAEKGEQSKIPFWFVPFIQLNLGLKAKVVDPVYLLVDFGILDGFVLRGGIAVRI
jgi:hypothetical protein